MKLLIILKYNNAVKMQHSMFLTGGYAEFLLRMQFETFLLQVTCWGESSDYKDTILCLIAYAIASDRLETCSLERMLLMWAFTVARLMTMASAICWLL